MLSRKWIALVVIILVVAAGTFWFLNSGKVAANVSEKDLISVQRVNWPLIVDATGTLESLKGVEVGPPQINRERRFKLMRMVPEGTQVSEGDFLMEFDTSGISERLRDQVSNFQRTQENRQKKRSDADLQLKNQKLTLEQAKTELDKLELKLSSQVDLISGIEIEKLGIQRDAQRRKVEFLEEKLDYQTKSSDLDLQLLQSDERHYRDLIDELMDAMDSYTVRSPASGVVIYKRDWDNKAKEVGDDVFFVDSVIQIPDLSSLRARVQIDEFDSGKVAVGQKATIAVDAARGQTLNGEIISVGTILKQASFDREQKICDAYIKINPTETKLLRPGMSLKAMIMVGEYTDVLVIPLSSVQEREGRSFVQVWKPKTKSFEWREISMRANDGIRAVVDSGLEAEEQVRIKPRV
jgi:HlyD family secretion protein